MIKVENNMLVLDSTFSKEDVKAIDEFVKINVDKERERIIKLLEENTKAFMAVENPTPYQMGLVDGAVSAYGLIKNFGE